MKNKERYLNVANAIEAYCDYKAKRGNPFVATLSPKEWLEATYDPADELLPCPFCGWKPKLEGWTNGCIWVECVNSSCPANPHAYANSGLQSERVQNAIAKWNTRNGVKPEEKSNECR